MRTLLLVGDDKIGRRLIRRITLGGDVTVAIDASFSVGRVWRLLRRRAINVRGIAQMALAEFQRPREARPRLTEVRSNKELLTLMRAERPDRVVLFRAGLIVNGAVIDSGPELLNVHCAKLPQFAGLGAVGRALDEKDYDQCATMHHVTNKIDAGEVVVIEPYSLDPARSYCDNEDTAYEAGIQLILRVLADTVEAAA